MYKVIPRGELIHNNIHKIAPRGGIYTFTGRHVSPLELRSEDIDIRDIAHALALTNRFAGHTPEPISVAQHSVYVSQLCPQHALQGLLHDASEAYLGDMTKWLKGTEEMAPFRKVEDRAQEIIFRTFGVETVLHLEVEVADHLMVRLEASRAFGPLMPLFSREDYPYPSVEEIDKVVFSYWGWDQAEDAFLERFYQLTSGI